MPHSRLRKNPLHARIACTVGRWLDQCLLYRAFLSSPSIESPRISAQRDRKKDDSIGKVCAVSGPMLQLNGADMCIYSW